MRRFGVGNSERYPIISGLSKLESEPPIWFLDIDEERIELNTVQLQNYRDFQKACMEQITIMYMPMKVETWTAMVGEAMTNAHIIEASDDMSTRGHFLELLETFCTDRHAATMKDEILLGKPWLDEEEGKHFFQLRSLMQMLERENFKVWGRNKVGSILSEIGGKKGMNIKGQFRNTFWVPSDFLRIESIDLPETERSPI